MFSILRLPHITTLQPSAKVLVLLGLLATPLAAQRLDRAVGRPATGIEPEPVVATLKISNEVGGFPDSLDNGDELGHSIAALGDVDGDGVGDVAVGYREAFVSEVKSGGIWILFLRPDGTVRSHQRISSRSGGFTGDLNEDDQFGWALAGLGDLDGDGIPDLATSATGDDDLGGGSLANSGAIYILFLEADGTVREHQKISAAEGNFTGVLSERDSLGASLAGLGDLDGDGVNDLVAGANQDDDGSTGQFAERGALWVLFLHTDGTVKAQQKISSTSGGFAGPLADRDFFGSSVANLGDLDGDGVTDIVAGAIGDDDGGDLRGAAWVLFLNSDGTVKGEQKISDTAGAFVGALRDEDQFGTSLATLGDLDGNGRPELAVGESEDDSGGQNRGAVWVLFLRVDGTVRTHQKISDTAGGFTGTLSNQDRLGRGVAALGDLNGDGLVELGAGAPGDDDGGNGNGAERGAAWILSLNADGTVASHQKLSDGTGGFPEGTLDRNSSFGADLTWVGDIDGDGVGDLAVGAVGDGDGGNLTGAVWILFLEASGTVKSYQKISASEGGLTGPLDAGDRFGSALAPLGDVDGDGIPDLGVGSSGSDLDRGAIWILCLHPDGTVKSEQKIGHQTGGFPDLERDAAFGSSLSVLGDLDDDGEPELAVGAALDSDGGSLLGSVWVLFLNPDRTVRTQQKISTTQGDFDGALLFRDRFGTSLAPLGDLNEDGIPDLAVGAPGDSEGGSSTSDRGAVWVLFLEAGGTVQSHQKVNAVQGGFGGQLDVRDYFGSSLAALGDLNKDGRSVLAVGARGDDDGASSSDRGAIWLLTLGPDGMVLGERKVSATAGGFDGELGMNNFFGIGLTAIGDRDGDGVQDLVAGASGDDDGGESHGALWLLSLDGLANIGFEENDAQTPRGLVNGQSLFAPGGFERTIALSSTGANLGAAVFESTPGGPNEFSQDPDLLVGRGNLLILQNSLAPQQSSPGVFDRPNDDQDGGRFAIEFQEPVLPLAIDLIDIDLGFGQEALVSLFDVAGRERAYTIPAGWTEDRIIDGGLGWRTLDLTSTSPQAGYAAATSVVETMGFEATAVVRLEVWMGSSGAIDNICWDPHPQLAR